MNCDEVQSELERQLDAGLIIDDLRIREHCRICSACGEAWEGARLLADSIAAWRGQIPEVDLAEAVVAAYAQSQVRHADRRPNFDRTEPARTIVSNLAGSPGSSSARSRSALFAVAACIGAAIGIALLIPSSDVQSPGGSVVTLPRSDSQLASAVPTSVSLTAGPVRSTGPASPASDLIPTVAPGNEIALLKAGKAYETFTNSAVGAIGEFAWIVIPIRLSEPATEGSEVSPGRWIDSLQDHLRPFQQGLDDALDFLREAGDSPENSRT